MNDLEKLNFALEKQAEFAKETTEWIDELKEKYANIGCNKEHVDSRILSLVYDYMKHYANSYEKKEGENENV